MPIYEHSCSQCGTMELYRRMTDPQPTKCPHCGRAGLERIYGSNFIGAVDAGQETENSGMGRWYPSAGPQFLDAKTKTKRNPEAHGRSRYEIMEKMKRRGYGVEKA
jgi:putative FmdB family regulatory protein